ncbi:MAG TPA: HD domain-containing phosphohydrolase [Solirubrobacteraceae bacterium]|jgi:putative two-component system response regulator
MQARTGAGFARIGSLQALELSTALQLAALVKSSDDAVIVISPEGQITSWSPGAERLFGYSQREAVGQRVSVLSAPAGREEASALFARMLSGGRAERTHSDLLRKDGELLSVSLVMSPINAPSGELLGIAEIVRDISAQTLAEEELQAARLEDLAHLALAAECRDDGTHQHTERVATLAELIARELGMSAQLSETLRLAAPLHDIGKLGIPDQILLKAGGLSDDEQAEMKTHTTIGARILGASEYPVLGMAREIALTHHERWDGDGYPAGLRASAIPIAGRIVAVADVFDAITHARPYKEALPVEHAIAEITRASGTQFDAQVVEAFMVRVGDARG